MLSCVPVHHLSFQVEQQEYKGENHKENKQRCYREALVVQILKVVVHEVLQHVNAFIRHTAADEICFAERFERVYDGDNKDKEEIRDEQRECYVTKALQSVRPLKRGDPVKILGNGVEPREEQHDVIAAVFPHINPQQHEKRVF